MYLDQSVEPSEELPALLPRSLYVHVPFCARRCSYCDFAVEAMREPPVDAWLDAIERELRLTAEERRWEGPLCLDTLYVGGGTPSLLGLGAMAALRDRMEPYARLATNAEWSCEANPESFTAPLAADWKAAGVNRLSLGAQTFHGASLRWMGRLHGVEGPVIALGNARAAGFDNVSIDLIFGLPDTLGRDWNGDLDRIIELDPEHVSLYGLTAEAGAPLGRWVAEGREVLADEDRYADEYLLAHARLTDAGFEHYEVSNFARPGRRSRHNIAYWNGVPYAALGPGAHAFHPPVRRWNTRSWHSYREIIESGRLPVDGQEIVDVETAVLERFWLGLRTRAGLALRELSGDGVRSAERWAAEGLAEITDGTLRLTPSGWLLLDELVVSLGPPRDSETAPPALRGFDDRSNLVQIGATSTRFSG